MLAEVLLWNYQTDAEVVCDQIEFQTSFQTDIRGISLLRRIDLLCLGEHISSLQQRVILTQMLKAFLPHPFDGRELLPLHKEMCHMRE